MVSPLTRRAPLAAVAIALSLVLAGCGGAADGDTASAGSSSEEKLSGQVRVDGSSTVQPLTATAADLFREEQSDVQITVGTSGTGGGFEKFCAGETDISDASRPIKDEEAALCEKNGVAFEEFAIANDALSIIVNPENDWASCLTVDQLKKIWEPGSKVKNWKDVDASFPDKPLTLFGPGTDSGTFDYFTDEINGEEGASRTDYQASEDDNVIVTGVGGDEGALGYLGFSYVEENEGKIKAIEVDGGDGCVEPSADTTQSGDYKPLGRQLFIYPKAESLDKPEVEAFVEYYVENASQIAEEAGFIGLNDEQQTELEKRLEALRAAHGGASPASS